MEGQAEAIRTLKLPLIDGMTCDISVYNSFQTVIYLPEPATHANAGEKIKYRIKVENRGMRYLVQPMGWAPPTNINLRTSGAIASLHFSMTKSTDDAVTVIRFTYPHEWENPHAAIRELCGESNERHHLDLALMAARRDETGFAPGFRTHFIGGGHELVLTTGPLNYGNSRLSLHFSLQSVGTRDYPLTGFSIRDGQTDIQYLRCWRADEVRERPSAATRDAVCANTAESPLILRPGGRIEGEVTAENPEQLLTQFTLQVHTLPGVEPAVFRWADRRVPHKPPHNLHKLSIGLQGIGGAIRLDNATGLQDWTDAQGVGIRARSHRPALAERRRQPGSAEIRLRHVWY